MIIKLAINIPVSHLKGDGKELASMKKKAKGILDTITEMQAEDKDAMRKHAAGPLVPGVDPSHLLRAVRQLGQGVKQWAHDKGGVTLVKAFKPTPNAGIVTNVKNWFKQTIPRAENNLANATRTGLQQADALTSTLLKKAPKVVQQGTSIVKKWGAPALDVASGF